VEKRFRRSVLCMADTGRDISMARVLLPVFSFLFLLLTSIPMADERGGYFLLPDVIVQTYFPLSESYMIPEDKNVAQILQRARSYEEVYNYRQAARYYAFAYSRAKSSKAAPFIRFKQSFLAERSSESIEMLLEILDRYPDFPYSDAVRFDLARRYYLKEAYDKSEDSLRQILENEATGALVFTPYVYTFIGLLYQKEGRYEDAERSHSDAIELLASRAEEKQRVYIVANYLEISRCLLARTRWERAVDLLQRIIGTVQYPLVKQEAYTLLAEGYRGSGNPGAAHAVYQKLMDEFPDSPYRKKAKERIMELRQDPGEAQGQIGKLGYYDPAILEGRYRYGTEPEAAPVQGKFSIQIGSFSIEENAQSLIGILQGRGYSAFILETDLEENRLFRVRVGRYATLEQATEVKQKLESMGYEGYIVEEQ
jgi:tetratricopeptide (TPR) repeat protein